MKISDLRNKDNKELQKELIAISQEIFNLRLNKALGQPFKTDKYRAARRSIAQIKTILHERA